jgi:hypothetical protein
MSYDLPLCYSCKNQQSTIPATYIGGPLGACKARSQVPRKVFYEAGRCSKFVSDAPAPTAPKRANKKK